MNSIYKKMNMIDDEDSLTEKYDVRTLKDVKKLHESVNGPVTAGKVKKLIRKLKRNLPYGFLTVRDTAIRYVTEEMDLVEYATIDDLVKALNENPDEVEWIEEEPYDLLEYCTEGAGFRHSFEVEDFIEDVKRLNVKYFGSEIVDRKVDKLLMSHGEEDEDLDEGIFDGKAKKEAAYKEIIDNVFKDSEFRNPSASFGNVVKDCLSDWIDSLSSNDTTDERSGNASTYATTFVKQAMMLLKKLNKPTRDTVLEIIRFVRSLKFNNGEERPQSFDDLSDFYKLYINVLGKEKDGFKVQEYLAPMMCNSVKMPLEACIRQLESKHLIKK